jgi:transketolase
MTNTPAFAQAVNGVDGYEGRNIHFGVREHGMGAVSMHVLSRGGHPVWRHVLCLFRLYAPTAPLSALSHLGSIWSSPMTASA